MRKRKYRQAAACFLTAALVLSAGPVQSVLAETEASLETVQQEIPEEESYRDRDAGNGNPGRDRAADGSSDRTEYGDGNSGEDGKQKPRICL